MPLFYEIQVLSFRYSAFLKILNSFVLFETLKCWVCGLFKTSLNPNVGPSFKAYMSTSSTHPEFCLSRNQERSGICLLMGLHKQGSSSKAKLLIREYLVVVSVNAVK